MVALCIKWFPVNRLSPALLSPVMVACRPDQKRRNRENWREESVLCGSVR